MEYLEQIKQQPGLYNQLANLSRRYILDCGKELAFPTGKPPSLESAKELIEKAGFALTNSELEELLNQIKH